MSRFGTVLGGTVNSRFAIVEGASPEVLQIRTQEAGMALVSGLTDPVLTNITLTGAGDGHTFFVYIEVAEAANVDGGALPQEGRFFMAAQADALTAARGSISTSQNILDVQLAGAAKGTRVMGLMLFGTLVPPPPPPP